METLSSIWNTAWPILIAIIAFGLLITIHEFGHFIVAKKCGIKVNQFAIGFGPAIWKKQKGETEYSVRIFPLGGFCAMEGEDENSDDERAFGNKPVWKRILVVLAGSFNNLLLGLILFIIITAMEPTHATTTIAKFTENSISHSTGLEVGDTITSVNGSRVFVSSDIVYELLRDHDGVFEMTVTRNGEKVNLPNVTFELEEKEDYDYKVFKQDFYVSSEKTTFLTSITHGTKTTISYGRIVYKSLFDLLRGRFKVSDMSGPVGVVQAIGDATSEGFDDLLFLIAFISINLGLFNLLPFPGLDGGRFWFLAAEGITRKKIPTKYEAYINLAGLALLMLLSLVITYSDITKIF